VADAIKTYAFNVISVYVADTKYVWVGERDKYRDSKISEKVVDKSSAQTSDRPKLAAGV
jgi:hypothetical protein